MDGRMINRLMKQVSDPDFEFPPQEKSRILNLIDITMKSMAAGEFICDICSSRYGRDVYVRPEEAIAEMAKMRQYRKNVEDEGTEEAHEERGEPEETVEVETNEKGMKKEAAVKKKGMKCQAAVEKKKKKKAAKALKKAAKIAKKKAMREQKGSN